MHRRVGIAWCLLSQLEDRIDSPLTTGATHYMAFDCDKVTHSDSVHLFSYPFNVVTKARYYVIPLSVEKPLTAFVQRDEDDH